MTIVGAIASFFLKKAANLKIIKLILISKFLYLGGLLYFLTALFNIYVLKFLDYTVVLPLTSITYIWTMFISYLLLKEEISKQKILGVSMIVFGAFLIV